MNRVIIANLEVLLDKTQDKSSFRARAYRVAIKSIRECSHELQSGEDAKKLRGVGKGIAQKIDEIIKTGSLTQVDPEDLDKNKASSLFTSIWGVGPVKAAELSRLGAKTIEDVREKYQHVLNDNQKIGLKYYTDLQRRIPREQIKEVASRIVEELDTDLKIRVCGSFRRRLATCGDMDILLCNVDLARVVAKLQKRGILKETLGIGETKYMGIAVTSSGNAFRIDMESVSSAEWPFALLYFTGSGSFNERQRFVAKKAGYSLSEHGLKDVKTGAFVKGLTSERDIFDFLDMKFLPPWER